MGRWLSSSGPNVQSAQEEPAGPGSNCPGYGGGGVAAGRGSAQGCQPVAGRHPLFARQPDHQRLKEKERHDDALPGVSFQTSPQPVLPAFPG